MKGRKALARRIFVCIGTLLMCGCAGQRADVADKIRIGLACYNESDTFLSELIVCFREDVSRNGAIVTIKDAAGSQRTQDDQVEELIRAGCDVLCINLVDRSAPGEIIDIARENDVPIIFFNREPVAEDMMQWEKLYYVGADAKQSGMMQGELAAELIRSDSRIDRNRDGKIQYVVLEGEPGHQDAIIRTENAVEVLRSNQIELEKLSYGIANWNRAQAQNRMQQMIGRYQSQIELVLANNDDMALGAIDAYKEVNFTENAWPVFLGIDGTQDGLQAVLGGKLAGTVYNDKEGQAAAMAELAIALTLEKEGEKEEEQHPQYIYLPYTKISMDNVYDFLEEGRGAGERETEPAEDGRAG